MDARLHVKYSTMQIYTHEPATCYIISQEDSTCGVVVVMEYQQKVRGQAKRDFTSEAPIKEGL